MSRSDLKPKQIRALGDKIANLSPSEAKQLIRYLLAEGGEGNDREGVFAKLKPKGPEDQASVKLKLAIHD